MKKFTIFLVIMFAAYASLALAGRIKPADKNSKWEDIGGGYVQPTEGRSATAPNFQASDNVKITGMVTYTWLAVSCPTYTAAFTVPLTATHGSWIQIKGDTTATLPNLPDNWPANVYRQHFTAVMTGQGTGAGADTVYIDPAADDVIVLNGTWLDAGDKVTMLGSATELACKQMTETWFCRCAGNCADGGA